MVLWRIKMKIVVFNRTKIKHLTKAESHDGSVHERVTLCGKHFSRMAWLLSMDAPSVSKVRWCWNCARDTIKGVELLEEIREMSLPEIQEYIKPLIAEDRLDELPDDVKIALGDRLMSWAWECALLIDRLKGINIYDGPVRRLGTRNRKSTTYKVRKALRYSYP
jgi:hypothetical protein